MIERIDTVCLKVINVEESSEWYQNILGFKETYKGEGYRILSIGNSKVPLTIEEGDVKPINNGTYPIFFSKDINKIYKKLKEQGVNVSELHNDGVNNFFDFYDRDNNKLQICYWK
ncbi:VOC family protein [Neobacillus sp. FSL H8-0543]|uniref:VOC family protein n=1 Tax=Neobacillus sp. FSL H8-0543 TaxID=2954672 RepID=UPI0031586E4E